MNNIKLSLKLIVLIMVSVIAMILLGVVGSLELKNISNSTETISEKFVPDLIFLSETKQETERKIKNGTYTLDNLNKYN